VVAALKLAENWKEQFLSGNIAESGLSILGFGRQWNLIDLISAQGVLSEDGVVSLLRVPLHILMSEEGVESSSGVITLDILMSRRGVSVRVSPFWATNPASQMRSAFSKASR
jgi:hypothetical protein